MTLGGEYPYSEFDAHEGDTEWYEEGDEVYEDMLDQYIEDYGSDVIDGRAAELLYDGWFNGDLNYIDHTMARFEFFDYTGMDWEDFDWDTWREWYES